MIPYPFVFDHVKIVDIIYNFKVILGIVSVLGLFSMLIAVQPDSDEEEP